MRTTVEPPDQILRQAKAEAALAGVKLKDFIADALRAKLAELNDPDKSRPTPSVELRQKGRFQIPVTRSAQPASVPITADLLADLDLDLEGETERARDLLNS